MIRITENEILIENETIDGGLFITGPLPQQKVTIRNNTINTPRLAEEKSL